MISKEICESLPDSSEFVREDKDFTIWLEELKQLIIEELALQALANLGGSNK